MYQAAMFSYFTAYPFQSNIFQLVFTHYCECWNAAVKHCHDVTSGQLSFLVLLGNWVRLGLLDEYIVFVPHVDMQLVDCHYRPIVTMVSTQSIIMYPRIIDIKRLKTLEVFRPFHFIVLLFCEGGPMWEKLKYFLCKIILKELTALHILFLKCFHSTLQGFTFYPK